MGKACLCRRATRCRAGAGAAPMRPIALSTPCPNPSTHSTPHPHPRRYGSACTAAACCAGGATRASWHPCCARCGRPSCATSARRGWSRLLRCWPRCWILARQRMQEAALQTQHRQQQLEGGRSRSRRSSRQEERSCSTHFQPGHVRNPASRQPEPAGPLGYVSLQLVTVPGWWWCLGSLRGLPERI